MDAISSQKQGHIRTIFSVLLIIGVSVFLGTTASCLLIAQAPASAPTPVEPVPEPMTAPSLAAPIAIISIQGKNAPQVTGSLEVSAGRVMIGASGSVTAGNSTAEVVLPRRGVLKVCANTRVQLITNSNLTVAELRGLMMALDHGAIEASYATTRNTDIVMTPDFRMRLDGKGAAEVKIRLGQNGDTCIDNSSAKTSQIDVVVSSVFEGGAYRIQPGQRVMFEHGSLREVVDQEKEPCGCPPPITPGSNEFPLAESAGLIPLSGSAQESGLLKSAEPIEALTYNAPKSNVVPLAPRPPSPPKQIPEAAKTPSHKPGIFRRFSHFLGRIFGAEE